MKKKAQQSPPQLALCIEPRVVAARWPVSMAHALYNRARGFTWDDSGYLLHHLEEWAEAITLSFVPDTGDERRLRMGVWRCQLRICGLVFSAYDGNPNVAIRGAMRDALMACGVPVDESLHTSRAAEETAEPTADEVSAC